MKIKSIQKKKKKTMHSAQKIKYSLNSKQLKNENFLKREKWYYCSSGSQHKIGSSSVLHPHLKNNANYNLQSCQQF